MMRKSNLHVKYVSFLVSILLVTSLAGCGRKESCLYPGCDNEAISGTPACYEHRIKEKSSIGNNAASGYDESTRKESNIVEQDNKKENTGNTQNSYNSRTSNNKTKNEIENNTSEYREKNYETYDIYDYDDPHDYAYDYAKQYAYDEFGELTEEFYEYGYEEAYNDWMYEMDEEW